VPLPLADLVRLFENDELEPAAFRHADHVRTGWALLQHHDFFEALSRLRTGLKSLAARGGRPAAYNETITVVFLALIYERIGTDQNAGCEAFLRGNRDLLDRGLLRRFYSPQRLTSAQARTGLVMPDLCGIAP
jgi:hypothetical protein